MQATYKAFIFEFLWMRKKKDAPKKLHNFGEKKENGKELLPDAKPFYPIGIEVVFNDEDPLVPSCAMAIAKRAKLHAFATAFFLISGTLLYY